MTTPTHPPRIAHLMPPYAPDVAERLALMMPPDSAVEPLKLFRTFARHMPLARAIGPLGGYMLGRGDDGGAAFDPRARELVIDRVTARCGCEYEWGVHVASFGDAVGLTEEQTYSTVHGSGADPCWSDRDRAVLDMTDDLHDEGGVSDATYARLAAHFDESQILDLFVLAGWYHAISYIANGTSTELEAWAPRFPPL